MSVSILLCIPLVVTLVAFLFRSQKVVLGSALVGSVLTFMGAVVIGVPGVLGEGTVSGNGFWYVDALSGLMLLLIGFIQCTGTLTSLPYLRHELSDGTITIKEARRYVGLLALFVFSMLLTVVSNNLGIMWIALEATTLATTLLVAFYARAGSIEAAWKYLILCSTGITLGLLGLMVVYYSASVDVLLTGLVGMEWTTLSSVAGSLSPDLLKIAFALVLVGFGTKVGIVPMHTWLPDAHSRAPSPISGMLSGVLLNAALFAILRYRSLTDGALGTDDFTNTLFLTFGALTVAVPAAFVLMQKDYKRLLAYSSIEHMGLVLFSAGLGVFGGIAAAMHMVGHALIKSMLFFAAGNVLLRFKSTKFENVTGVMRALPITGAFFLCGIFLLLAVPPSPLFMSEYLLVSAAVLTHPYLTAVVLLSLAIVAAGFLYAFMPFFFAEIHDEHRQEGHKETWNMSHTALLLHIILIIAAGIFIWSDTAYAILLRIAELIV